MKDFNSLAGRAALITGGTSGIGEAAVRLFVDLGANVVFTGRNAEKGDAIAKGLGPSAAFFKADVLVEEEIKASVDHTMERFGAVNILFNNAGGGTLTGIETVTPEAFHKEFDLLVGSVLFGIKHAVPHMRKNGFGRIINNSSVAAIRTHMGGYLYSGAKASVSQLTRMAGMELGCHNITVNAVSPGAIATPVFYGGSERARTLSDEDNARKMEKLNRNLASANPMQRAGQPEDVAALVAFLATDAAKHINCQDIAVDGGMTAGGRDQFQR